MKLDKKIALITGGTGGLGEATARLFYKEGATVVITDLDNIKGKILAEEISGDYFEHDVTDYQAWEKIVHSIIHKYGKIDILVQFAGIEGDFSKDVLNVDPENWNKVIQVNLTGTFYGCRTVVPEMLKIGQGSVINISSIASYMATPGPAAYGASKAGVQHLTTSVALAAAQNNSRIRVNSIHPGVIKTRMTDNIVAEMAKVLNINEKQAESQLMERVPFQERGTPDDVANVALFLASDDSTYVTGSHYQVDGGWHLKGTGQSSKA